MSYELLLLFAVIVLLPFTQVAIRAARHKAHRRSEDGRAGPSRNQPPANGSHTVARWDVPPPSPSATAADSAPRAVTAREAPASRVAMGPRSVPANPERVGHQVAAKANLRDRAGLRRAVVLASILGPCRANEPDARREIGAW